jgi:hypothetical protein
MRLTRKLALAATLLTLTGCGRHTRTVKTDSPMPPNTVLLSASLRELTAQHPQLVEHLLAQLDKGGKKGPALLTPRLIDELRKRILGKDWSGLDRFPGWTMREINPTVRVIGHFAGKDAALEAASEAHPGAAVTSQQARTWLDFGPYALDKAETISLDKPSTLPAFTTQGIVSELGDGFIRGDGPNKLSPEHAESQRLADVLNRLAANKLDGAQSFAVTLSTPLLGGGPNVPPSERGHASSETTTATSPEDLMRSLQQSGHTVTVDDARYFANFAHLHYKGEDVMAPFWIDTRLKVPNSHGRKLLVPVSHAELEWRIRGPVVNADVSYYFGVDGKSEWRTMDTLDQAWVQRRAAHTYASAQAIEATRLTSLLTVAYMHLHAAHPALPFGGYYALGVCQDGVSAIEHKLTGSVTLFPNTADTDFFIDARDAEINALFHLIPKDRGGEPPLPERIFGSLPVAPAADPDHAFDAVTIPGLADDLNACYKDFLSSPINGTRGWRTCLFAATGCALVLMASAIFAIYRRDRRSSNRRSLN